MRTTLTALAAGALLAGTLALPAAAAHEELVVTGLTQNDKLVTFEAGTGERLSQVKVTGIEAGQRLVAIDYRPSTGGLYGVAVDGTNGYLYLVDDVTGQATRVAEVAPFAVSGAVSIDVNPVPDALRVVSTAGDNLRIVFATGAVNRDAPLNAEPASAFSVVGAAYTNSDTDPATATTLYDVDATGDRLLIQNPPNAGTLTVVGPLGIDVDEVTGFDVYTDGTRNTALLSSRSRLFTVDLATGAVNQASGVRAQGAPVVDIAVDTAQ